jgi:hypothetical protein
MRYLGMLLTLAIICIVVFYAFKSLGVGSSDAHDAEWFYNHSTERADQLKWCNDHPQQQDSSDCLSAVSAQTRVDTERSAKP